MTRALLVLIAAGAVAFQAICAPWYDLAGVRPDFVAMFVAAVALDRRRADVWSVAIAAGVLLDLASISPFGVHLLSYLFLVVVLRQGVRGRLAEDAVPRAILVAVGLAAAVTVKPLFAWLFSGEEPVLSILPVALAYTLVVASFAVPVATRYTALVGERARDSFS